MRPSSEDPKNDPRTMRTIENMLVIWRRGATTSYVSWCQCQDTVMMTAVMYDDDRHDGRQSETNWKQASI